MYYLQALLKLIVVVICIPFFIVGSFAGLIIFGLFAGQQYTVGYLREL